MLLDISLGNESGGMALKEDDAKAKSNGGTMSTKFFSAQQNTPSTK